MLITINRLYILVANFIYIYLLGIVISLISYLAIFQSFLIFNSFKNFGLFYYYILILLKVNP